MNNFSHSGMKRIPIYRGEFHENEQIINLLIPIFSNEKSLEYVFRAFLKNISGAVNRVNNHE